MTGGRDRIARRFRALAGEGRAAFIPFLTAGDPDRGTSSGILARLPGLGADLIELGMPFSDPMADGPSIQAAGERALRAGQTMADTLAMVSAFRAADTETPLVLMGYFNPIYRYGAEAFAADARSAGVDGLIVVDLPPEEDEELRLPAEAAGLALIRLVAPTTGDARLRRILADGHGFVYYVSVTGITGTKSAMTRDVAAGLERIRKATDLPVAVGFGVRDAGQAAEIASVADAVVVGSAIVQRIASSLTDGRAGSGTIPGVEALIRELAGGVRNRRPPDAEGADG